MTLEVELDGMDTHTKGFGGVEVHSQQPIGSLVDCLYEV